MWRRSWRHTRPYKNRYTSYVISVFMYQVHFELVVTLVDLGAHQIKHQSSVSLAFVQEIHWWPVNSPHKRPVTRKMFPFDDVIMSESSTHVMQFPAYVQENNHASNPQSNLHNNSSHGGWDNADNSKLNPQQYGKMTSLHGNGFRITGPLWGDPMRGIPSQKNSIPKHGYFHQC